MTEALWLRVVLPGLFLTASGLLLGALVLAIGGAARVVEPHAEDELLVLSARRRLHAPGRSFDRVDLIAAGVAVWVLARIVLGWVR